MISIKKIFGAIVTYFEWELKKEYQEYPLKIYKPFLSIFSLDLFFLSPLLFILSSLLY
jgi:hypothetical protein